MSSIQETLPGSNGEEPPGEVGLVTYPVTYYYLHFYFCKECGFSGHFSTEWN